MVVRMEKLGTYWIAIAQHRYKGMGRKFMKCLDEGGKKMKSLSMPVFSDLRLRLGCI